MNRQFERYLQMTLAALDLFVITIVYFFSKIFTTQGIPVDYWSVYFQYWTLSVVTWLLLSFFLRTYAGKVILVFDVVLI